MARDWSELIGDRDYRVNGVLLGEIKIAFDLIGEQFAVADFCLYQCRPYA